MAVNRSWGGRFSTAPEAAVAIYTDSQHFDRNLYAQDILGSQAHARMLARQKILTDAEAEAIVKGLEQIKQEIETGQFNWQPELEDVHMNIEARLVEIIGDVGKKLHTGRSRNDQVGLAFRLFVADRLKSWQKDLANLVKSLVEIAKREKATILPGFTHLQPAQPVALAHHLLAHAWTYKRDYARIGDALSRVCKSPLGAAALAGSTFPLDPLSVAKEVNFSSVYENSMDAVSDRDFVLEALFAASCIMLHLSRQCEELIIWSNPAFNFVKISDAYTTGSSIMPQKKNPDVAELMRGKTGRVYGALMGLLTTLKGLPLTYNRDLQEDKEGFLDTDQTISQSLPLMSAMLGAIEFKAESMRVACKKGFLNATELADYLVSKGLAFRDAHHVSGRAVKLAETKGCGLEDLSLAELQDLDKHIAEDVFLVLDYQTAVKRRETYGGTGPNSVNLQIEKLQDWLENLQA